MVAAIFWDMDGTMVDSEPLWSIATYELSERLGRRLSAEERARTVGGCFANTLEVCARYAGYELKEEDYVIQHDILFDRMRGLFREHLTPQPGIRELLADLNERGIPLYVTTNTERELADSSIAAVGTHFFHGSVTGDEVPRPKPAPDLYLHACEIAGAAPGECLVFEDSTSGQRAAIEAGCRVIGVPSEDGQQMLENVVSLRTLRLADGCPAEQANTFVGVRAADVERWFDHL